MKIEELPDWFDRHHVDSVRTFATTLDGPAVGKHLHRDKFFSSLPNGHAIADMALNMDINGDPHMTSWHHQREPNFGDIFLKPDLKTLISDGTDKLLGHCICDFTNSKGEPLELCPRSMLKKVVAKVEALGYQIKSAFELEFYLFEESYGELHRTGYRRLTPISASRKAGIYNLRNSFVARPFMNEVIKRIEWRGIPWEGWNDEAGLGQLELNMPPADPVTAADRVAIIKQIIYETARDMDVSSTFMAAPGESFSSGMHIHYSLLKDDQPVFYSEQAADHQSDTMKHWLAGMLATLGGAVSYLCPTVNSYRRFKQFAAVPMTRTWGADNKTTALRTITSSPKATRIEHRVASGDTNPYLALAVILAGGLVGEEQQLMPPKEFKRMAWGMPASDLDLPITIKDAATALKAEELLKGVLGKENVEYWAKTREMEWLAFHTEGADPYKKQISDWELERYFEMI